MLYLAMVAVLGAAAALLPSLATGSSGASSASFTAVDFNWQAGGGGTQVTIPQGGTVSFSYPSGSSSHNADFGSGPQPTTCSQAAGASSGSVPPLPNQPTAPGWSGSCTFNTPGTYTFHCDLHPFMTGTIVVQAPGSTTSSGTTTSTPSPATSSSPGSGAPAPRVGASAASISPHQRGLTVRGLVTLAHGASRFEVDLLVSARSIGRRRGGRVRVGQLVRGSLPPGTESFAVPLNALGKRALRHHGSLALTVEVLVRSSRGRVTLMRRVVLRP